jgi:glycerol uptake facilitator-like aquaporin
MKLARALVAEALGTAFLLATVVGSGALADKLDLGNLAVSVLCVAFATGAVLIALIAAFGSISAHFNPIVTMVLTLRGDFSWKNVAPYVAAQVAGAILGVVVANLMFDLPAVSISATTRSGMGQWLGEFIASFGLIGIILGSARSNSNTGIAVPAYVAGAIYFTSSTCFANPAVTIARMFTNTLTGIVPVDVPAFVVSQIVGALCAAAVFGWLFAAEKRGLTESCQLDVDPEVLASLERELAAASSLNLDKLHK